MKRQGTGNRGQGLGIRDQGLGIRDQGSGSLEALLREAVPPVMNDADSSPDLWPAMQRRLRAECVQAPARVHVPWFDWALAGGLATMLVLFPAWIPVILYYL